MAPRSSARKRKSEAIPLSPAAASSSSPVPNSASSHTPTSKQAQRAKKKRKLGQLGQEAQIADDVSYHFSKALVLEEIGVLPTVEWIPATEKEVDDVFANNKKYNTMARRPRSVKSVASTTTYKTNSTRQL
ncbi:hypothetical protein PG989_016608 [Apiospora arundinis]|uniref:Uncharacterized protein n=1 Tax=Apiospora arundinis TaxID=335852 RepID=A0ABR2JFM1_9PEZI